MPARVRMEVGSDIQRVHGRWPVGKPLVDGFGAGLYEVRTQVDNEYLPDLFWIEDGVMVLLHGFGKKSQKTPASELEIAKKAEARNGSGTMTKHVGSTLESLFEELGEREDVELLTQKKLLAGKVQRAMARRQFTQTDLARAMATSRTVVHRLLDPHDTGLTLSTIARASKALGVRLLRVA